MFTSIKINQHSQSCRSPWNDSVRHIDRRIGIASTIQHSFITMTRTTGDILSLYTCLLSSVPEVGFELSLWRLIERIYDNDQIRRDNSTFYSFCVNYQKLRDVKALDNFFITDFKQVLDGENIIMSSLILSPNYPERHLKCIFLSYSA